MLSHLLRLVVLIKIFFFLPWAARLILCVGIPAAVIAAAAKMIGAGSWEPFLVIGGAALSIGTLAIYITVALMMFPVQLMVLVSSRQYGLLPHIRRYLAVLVVLVLPLLQIIACCILVFGIKSDHVLHLSLVVAIMLIVSFVVIMVFVNLGYMQFLYFFGVPMLGWWLVPQLKLMSDFMLLGILGCVWAAFLTWWFAWHPKKYYKSLLVMNAGELNKHNLSFCGGIYSRGAIPKNLGAGILFGQFGNEFYQVRLFLMTVAFMGSIFALMFMLAPHDVGEGLMVGVRMACGIQIIQIGYNYSMAVFKNINKFWLYFSLERKQLFNSVERVVAVFYLKNLTAVTAIILTVSFCVPSKYLPLASTALSVLASLLITPLSLYAVFIIYAKWRGNIRVFHWVNGVLMILLMGGWFLALKFFDYNGVENYLGCLLIIVSLLVGLIIVMRQYAQKLWQQIDLVRVAS